MHVYSATMFKKQKSEAVGLICKAFDATLPLKSNHFLLFLLTQNERKNSSKLERTKSCWHDVIDWKNKQLKTKKDAGFGSYTKNFFTTNSKVIFFQFLLNGGSALTNK